MTKHTSLLRLRTHSLSKHIIFLFEVMDVLKDDLQQCHTTFTVQLSIPSINHFISFLIGHCILQEQ